MRRPVPSMPHNRAGVALVRATATVIVCAITIGCTPPPDLSGRVRLADSTTPWPNLLTSAQLAQRIAPPSTQTAEHPFVASTAGLSARAAALRARAARMTGPVLDTATRRRLQAAIARHN